MHQFIKDLQRKSLPEKLRVKVQEETAKAIEGLFNSCDEIPGLGKLVVKIDIENDEISLQVGIRPPASSTPEHTQG